MIFRTKYIRRRLALGAVVLFAACTNATLAPRVPAVYSPTPREAALLDTVAERTFRWFWDATDARTGLTPDRWPTRTFSSVAAIGFALTAYPVGAERGWISRAQAAERTLTTLRYLYRLPQDRLPRRVAIRASSTTSLNSTVAIALARLN